MIKTTSLELSKQLKEARFEQETSFWWCSSLRTDGNKEFYVPLSEVHHATEIEDYDYRKDYAAPTAEEILERLPAHLGKNEDYQPVLNVSCFDEDKGSEIHWKVAYVENEEEGSILHIFGNSLAEAAGKMYLSLKKNKLFAEQKDA